ncbi:SHOCT domain-containing protein [Glutamicibacter sp.]|uniref:SHOCT domain-containing protein n=1 Tax=Glutamicibacter sp. TaxID=1931995 RepID=UPI0037BF9212
MNILGDIWSLFWYTLLIFAFFSYLIALFSVIGDLFRDHKLNGWLKALWMVLLIFVPFITLLVYLIARGKGMAERQVAQVRQAQGETENYIRSVAETSPAQAIADAKKLLDAGTITAEEYAALKAKALA